MTPMARRIADAQKNQAILINRELESFLSPRVPPNRILRVLQKVWVETLT
jgi:hypothetical protein